MTPTVSSIIVSFFILLVAFRLLELLRPRDLRLPTLRRGFWTVHANVDWDWGPFRAVIVSPRFHRWHHTAESEARDKNFAGLLPIWDLLFGTYYMPKDRRPASFGTSTTVPAGLLGQLAFPFRGAQES